MDIDFQQLYSKYEQELYELSRALRPLYHSVLNRGFRATFGDVEGEVLYLLLRELKPDVVFEISPDCGWSTNYILAALTANQTGQLHSFELATSLNGKPVEQAIHENLHSKWEQDRFTLHIGDAMETTEQVEGPINFLFLDSCHEEFFAKWYVEKLFPRVEGVALVQDIAFEDQLEFGGEAEYMWNWIDQTQTHAKLVGEIERELASTDLRSELPERRGLRSNSVVFKLPQTTKSQRPSLARGPLALIDAAERAIADQESESADRLLNRAIDQLLHQRTIVNRHRLLLRAGLLYREIGEHAEAERCLSRALGVVLQADPNQRRKGLKELSRWHRKQRHWQQMGLTWWLRMFSKAA